MARTQIHGGQVKDQSITEDDLQLTDVTTLNADINRHGFMPKLPNDANKYLNGQGAFTTPKADAVSIGSVYKAGTNIYEVWHCNTNAGYNNEWRTLFFPSLYAVPVYIMKTITIDRIAISLHSAAIDTSLYYGLYNDSGNLYPGDLIVSSQLKDCSQAGAKITAVNVTLQPGLYWAAMVASDTAILKVCPTSGLINILGVEVYGENIQVSSGIGILRHPYTFAPLPSIFPTSDLIPFTINPFLFLYRVASTS